MLIMGEQRRGTMSKNHSRGRRELESNTLRDGVTRCFQGQVRTAGTNERKGNVAGVKRKRYLRGYQSFQGIREN